MTKNRGLWVALAVLVAASLLMFFVVLPALRDDKTVKDLAGKVEDAAKTAADKATEQAKQATDAAKTAVDQAKQAAQDATGDLKSTVLGKMGRLKADTLTAADELSAIYAKGAPDAAALAAARAKLELALKAASAVDVPAGLDAALAGVLTKTSDAAKAALAALASLPSDPAQAAAAVDGIKAQIAGAFDAAEKAMKGEAAAADQAATNAADAGLPTFDVLRVEKDGSTVIAGKASPEAKIEVIDGDKPIAETKATDTGDFAAVLDNPLPPGDHTIVLKATTKDGKSAVSAEIATVSVPKDASGELLAMVTKAGEASRIITAPTAADTKVAAADTAKSVEPAKDAAATTNAATQTAGTVTTPELPAAATDIANTAPVIGTEPKQAEPAQEPAKEPAKASEPEVQVSAVEIEGDHLFVAGAAKPGATVRIYADDKFLGEGKANEAGRFVIDNVMPLSVGSHTIRADVMSADGSKVEFRASVPFDRPAGEQLAVVADQNAQPGTDLVPLDTAKLTKARDDAAKALALLNGLFSGGKMPTTEELAAARSANEIALKTLADFGMAGDPSAKSMADAAAKALEALKALPADAAGVQAGLGTLNTLLSGLGAADVAMTTDQPKATDTKAATTTETPAADQSAQDAAKTDETRSADQTNADQAQTDQTKSDQPKADEPAKSNDAAATTDTKTGDQPKVIEQAPLKESKTSVIIRRGDTLWQISRRVYGRGVRYTTIYMANQDQIKDPDEIMPGQIFGVPDKFLPNSEELHREHLKDHHR